MSRELHDNTSRCRRKLRNGNATRRKLRNCGNVIKQVQVETPKLWECYQAGPGGNSEMQMLTGRNTEIVGMLPSRCPAEFPKLLCKDGNATRRKLRNCGNVTKRVQAETPKWKCYQAETPKLWECYQAGALRKFRH